MRTIKRFLLLRVMLGTGFCILAAAILFTVTPASATDGRDFAGFYKLTNVTDLVTEFRVTLSVRVFNYSDADVSDATVTLEDTLLPQTTYGSFSLVAVRDRESVLLGADFTVPRMEYEQWQLGGNPSLYITYLDAGGQTLRRMIELAPMLIEEGI